MKEILFLGPIFKSMIWGGDRLRTEFSYDIPDDNTGECWAISAHPKGDSTIYKGIYKGKTLSWLWDNMRHLFGYRKETSFPLLVKIIDAKKDLSIQVHPDDSYVNKHKLGSYGKAECWYILDCDKEAEIVIGHNAKDKSELEHMIKEKRWMELIKSQRIKKGDFFYITPGTVHAIKAGTMLLEIQQSSDITYRLYDYDRLDKGKARTLHIKESIEVINCPHLNTSFDVNAKKVDDGQIFWLTRSKYFTVLKIDLDGEMALEQDKDFMNLSIIDGEGEIDNTRISKGDHFILPYQYGQYKLKGKLSFIVSYIEDIEDKAL